MQKADKLLIKEAREEMLYINCLLSVIKKARALVEGAKNYDRMASCVYHVLNTVEDIENKFDNIRRKA